MNVIEWYFAFYPRRWTPFDIFGHVEAFGYTADSVWVFFDPQRTRTRLTITYMHDEVQQQIAARFASANLILKIPASDQKSAIPIGPPMTCATACAHLLGFRAFTPAGLRPNCSQQEQRPFMGQSGIDPAVLQANQQAQDAAKIASQKAQQQQAAGLTSDLRAVYGLRSMSMFQPVAVSGPGYLPPTSP